MLAPDQPQRYMMRVSASRFKLQVSAQEEGLRLEQLLRGFVPDLTRGAVRRLLDGAPVVWVDGRPAAKGQRMRSGQLVEVAPEALDPRPVKRPDLPLEVIAVADDYVVMDKPEGIPTHPLTPGETDTLAGRLAARFPECVAASPSAREGGLVQRLDRGTSGVICAARHARAYDHLRLAFTRGEVQKGYLALVRGHVETAAEVAGEIERVPGHPERVRLSTTTSSETAPRTRYRPLCRLGPYTLLAVSCTTGRRHQVRVHLASRGLPLVDDTLYGGSPLVGGGLAFLHASELTLDGVTHHAPLSSRRRAVLRALAEGQGWPG